MQRKEEHHFISLRKIIIREGVRSDMFIYDMHTFYLSSISAYKNKYSSKEIRLINYLNRKKSKHTNDIKGTYIKKTILRSLG